MTLQLSLQTLVTPTIDFGIDLFVSPPHYIHHLAVNKRVFIGDLFQVWSRRELQPPKKFLSHLYEYGEYQPNDRTISFQHRRMTKLRIFQWSGSDHVQQMDIHSQIDLAYSERETAPFHDQCNDREEYTTPRSTSNQTFPY